MSPTPGLPSPSPAIGPALTITDPAPGTTASVGSGFRIGWIETAAPGIPIVSRTVTQYEASASDGQCGSASYALSSTDTAANRPFRHAVTGLLPGTCYYWVVRLTDLDGLSATARSGYVRRSTPADPSLDVIFPALGALSDAPPAETYAIRWSETVSAGAAARRVFEESAPMAIGRDCAGAAWKFSRTLTATADSAGSGASAALDGLNDGFCYRYRIGIRDGEGRRVTVVTGRLLVTTVPPPCASGDVLTTYRGDREWRRSLVDGAYRLSSRYVPGDLVFTRGVDGVNPSLRIRKVAYADLKAMADAARAVGTPIDLDSAYRSYALQVRTFDLYVDQLGLPGALLRAARPGHSEHQLGTAIDVRAEGGKSPASYADWATTKTGAWMAQNAWKYGWVMSYPKDETGVTCYQYEPWHYRYVGRTRAQAIHDSGLTLREYLWRHGSLAPGA